MHLHVLYACQDKGPSVARLNAARGALGSLGPVGWIRACITSPSLKLVSELWHFIVGKGKGLSLDSYGE